MKMVGYREDEIPEPSEKRKAELRALAEKTAACPAQKLDFIGNA